MPLVALDAGTGVGVAAAAAAVAVAEFIPGAVSAWACVVGAAVAAEVATGTGVFEDATVADVWAPVAGVAVVCVEVTVDEASVVLAADEVFVAAAVAELLVVVALGVPDVTAVVPGVPEVARARGCRSARGRARCRCGRGWHCSGRARVALWTMSYSV